jgi:hypothetical protein
VNRVLGKTNIFSDDGNISADGDMPCLQSNEVGTLSMIRNGIMDKANLVVVNGHCVEESGLPHLKWGWERTKWMK